MSLPPALLLAESAINNDNKQPVQQSSLAPLDRDTPLYNHFQQVKCSRCRKRFDTHDLMLAHRETHLNKMQYACSVCEKTFTTQSSVWKHIKAHSGERPFICEMCHKGFTQLANLHRHYLVHNGMKPFKCPLCEKCFSQHANMIKHQLLHTGEKPFKCKSCQKAFAQRANLKKHEMIHLGLRPHSCPICLKSYSQYANMKKHLLVHEKDKNPAHGSNSYQCAYCKSVFDNFVKFERHSKECTELHSYVSINESESANEGKRNETIKVKQELSIGLDSFEIGIALYNMPIDK